MQCERKVDPSICRPEHQEDDNFASASSSIFIKAPSFHSETCKSGYLSNTINATPCIAKALQSSQS